MTPDKGLSLLRLFGARDHQPRFLCRIFGHRWFEFDHDWCSVNYFMCRRCKIVKHECNEGPSQ